ncbi:protein kinase, putative [Bodo saltans]|uniref:Protein kinase, putative n=1 Tax=Bodo saltans TaxID=75058 RepID=A0A0S4J3J3_BODSA|nr:protein kinase, putative [Bodo saltans]|eukprot:CUG74862.1 protein kinase, putative [Bodo saltans]
MDFNALQRDLMDAAVVHAAHKKKARRHSSITNGGGGSSSGSAFSSEREGPTIKDMYVFIDELGHGAYGSVMRARKRRKNGDDSPPMTTTPVTSGPANGGYVGLHAASQQSQQSTSTVGSPASASSYSSEQQFAVKIIDKKKAGSKGLSEVMGEVETMRLLNQPNIVKLEEIFETDDCLYIVMEYVPGGELHQVLKRTGPLPEATARQIIIQLLLAVEYIHQRGIVHRDLKPANMLLRDEQDWQIKLADFGFAVLVGTENCLTSYCGTGAYMAPEIVLDMNYGKAVDIWAVGVILYVIMSGDYPFFPAGGQDVQSSIIANKWQRTMHQRIADASPGAKDFLSKLLTTDANKRLTAKEALKHTWIQAALQGLTHRVEAASTMGNRSGGNAVQATAHVVPPRMRFRSWVHVLLAMHRLVYWRKIRVLRQNQADVAPLKSFTYLVSGPHAPCRSSKHHGKQKRWQRCAGHRTRRSPTYEVQELGARVTCHASTGVLEENTRPSSKPSRRRPSQVLHVLSEREVRTAASSWHRRCGRCVCTQPEPYHSHVPSAPHRSEHLRRNLRSDNNIDSVDTIQAIVKALISLISHPSLTNLFLENNPIPALAGRSLVRLARAPNRIRSIKLGGTLVGSDVLQQVTSVLKEKKFHGVAGSGGGGGNGGSGEGSGTMVSINSTNSLLSAGHSATTGGQQHHYISTSPIPPSSSNTGSSSALAGVRMLHNNLGITSNHHHPTTPYGGGPPPTSSRSVNGASSSGSGSALSLTTRSNGTTHHSTTLISSSLGQTSHNNGAGLVTSAGKRTSVSGNGQHPSTGPQQQQMITHHVVSPHGSQQRMTRFQPLSQQSSSTTQSKLPPIPSSGSSGGGSSTSSHPIVPRKR